MRPLRPSPGRPLPDFAIIGMMKAGTTSLHAWLAGHHQVFLPVTKEPDFFSREAVWRRGFQWYEGLFAGAAGHLLCGEASVSYTFPEFSDLAATRLTAATPEVKVICLVRHPLARTRSHYRHQVLRGRERRTFTEAVYEPGSEYISRSLYWTCLKPYVDRLPRERILIVRSEDLFGPGGRAWLDVLDFLAVQQIDRPQQRLNAADQKPQFSRAMRGLWEVGIRRTPRGTPAVLRRLARRSLLKTDPSPLLRTSTAAVDSSLTTEIWADSHRLANWIGTAEPLWTVREKDSSAS